MFSPQFKSMSLPSSQDQTNADDDDDIIYFKSPKMESEETGAAATHNPTQTPCDSNHTEASDSSLLQLRTFCTAADFDLNLGQIAQQLKDSLDSTTLSYAPQYTLMDLPTDDENSAIPGDDLQYDIANPPITDGCSVYVGQVNH